MSNAENINDLDMEGEQEQEQPNDDDNSAAAASDAASEDTVEPDCDKANALSFHQVCKRMEMLWSLKRTTNKNKPKKKVSEIERKKYLLPPKLLQVLEGESVFPLLRLLMPDMDNARNCNMKEKLIALAYCHAEGFAKNTTNYDMLYGFTDPQKVPHTMAGDLSLVVEHVMSKRIPNTPSKVTVGQLNVWLDDLVGLKQRHQSSHAHEWRDSQSQSQSQPKAKKKTSLATLREDWMRQKIMDKGRLSPLEHKWLVRILLQKMEFGLGSRAMLSYYSPYAMELWNSHNSLKNLCDKLADPWYYDQRRQQEQAQQEKNGEGGTASSQWAPPTQPAILGNTLTPMLSNKVNFAKCMTELQSNHQAYLKASKCQPHLSLKFPTICAEIKLDGERMMVHYNDQKQVTICTRQGKWYSPLYSPVIGPALRRALSAKKYDVTCILDGEMESWDNGRQELIPFGNNRTVANYRRLYLNKHGLWDPRDRNLHQDAQADASIMGVADDNKWVKQPTATTTTGETNVDPGKDCWLQFLVFDILYVGGVDAAKLLQDCGLGDTVSPGSMIHLPCWQRKLLLYRLLQEQPNEIEICKAVVIRPNGDNVSASLYFSPTDPPLMECGHPVTLLDSTQAVLDSKTISNWDEVDRQRRQGRSNTDISRLRSQAVDSFYRQVVEVHRFEGLVLKDLASPYILGRESKSRKYWHKFKPDYEQQGAADIDVLVLGAYFATGLRHSGKLSSFLCGCVDSFDRSTFMTLCNVNGGSVRNEELDQIMKATGFRRATEEQEETDLGKWFEEDEHGKTLPNFISQRSLQRGKEDHDGWRFNRNKNYPDLWIHPEDSVVLTIHGQELVDSEEYSAGVSLRFARISRVRHESVHGDEKPPSEVSDERDLWDTYIENMRKRQGYGSSMDSSAFSPNTNAATSVPSACRFLTPEEYGRKNKKRKRKAAVSPSRIPKVEKRESIALNGLSFTVLEGNYSLDPESLEAQEANDQGWLEKALTVKRKEDVMEFVLLHGGMIRVSAETNETFILGGRDNDARVVNYVRGIENAKSRIVSKPKTKKGLQLQNMAENDGVLKWTFIYSLVYRWKEQFQRKSRDPDASDTDERNDLGPIKQTNPTILLPKTHQYLKKVRTDEKAMDDILKLSREADLTKMELMRALQDLENFEGRSSEIHHCTPWQLRGVEDIDTQDRWALATTRQTLWPYQTGRSSSDPERVVIYPHLFQADFGTPSENAALEEMRSGSERWNEMREESFNQIASSLPLARAMGALVTPYLHAGVTHIICELKDDTQPCVHPSSLEANAFSDVRQGGYLLEYLTRMETPAHMKVVSPAWIRSQWCAK